MQPAFPRTCMQNCETCEELQFHVYVSLCLSLALSPSLSICLLSLPLLLPVPLPLPLSLSLSPYLYPSQQCSTHRPQPQPPTSWSTQLSNRQTCADGTQGFIAQRQKIQQPSKHSMQSSGPKAQSLLSFHVMQLKTLFPPQQPMSQCIHHCPLDPGSAASRPTLISSHTLEATSLAIGLGQAWL